ncbi:MAG TPA: alpha/beta fold hydrolase [Sphingomonadaceae bacterium]|nr:alpha/beta fold hydrolase [Sphingomonadaceae bacterium]
MRFLMAAMAALVLMASPAVAQQNITAPSPTVPEGITVAKVMVPGPSLEGNLEGNDTTRHAMVVLPPSYASSPERRYPVVYYLHGFAIDGENFYNFMRVPEAVANNAAQGREFIVVVPDSLTRLGGSMYSPSVTTGDFTRFIAHDLVAYIDGHYRTIARREGRALVGHSMGGYGTWQIGMRHPGVFAALWAQSACCVSPRRETVESAQRLAAIPLEDGIKADFGTRAALSSMVAWSPNPQNPPYYADFPIRDGALDETVLAKWANNSPLAMVASHIPALQSYAAIGADVGDKDGLVVDDTLIHEELARFGIAHRWEVYDGTHVDKIGPRFDSVVLPFMAEHLDMGGE